MKYSRILGVVSLVLGGAFLGGCVTDASQCGVPAPSWYSASLDGTVTPHLATARVSDPNDGKVVRWMCKHSGDEATASSVGPYDNQNEPWPIKRSGDEGKKDCCSSGGACCGADGCCSEKK